MTRVPHVGRARAVQCGAVRRAPSSHPSLAFTPWGLFPAVRIMNLHELDNVDKNSVNGQEHRS